MPKSMPNLTNFARLWQDTLRNSVHLSIEYGWAPLSQWLTGVTLPIGLEGKTSP